MIKTLDEAIPHYHQQAESQKKMAEYYNRTKQSERDKYRKGMCSHCLECAKEYEQLVEWLKQFAEIKQIVDEWARYENTAYQDSDTFYWHRVLRVFGEQE